MREILFRGKRIDNGEWVYGYYARKGADKESFRHYICVSTFSSDYQSNYTYPFYLYDYEVDPSTIEQYTGLTDKNGKKIFEGDIYTWKDDYGDYHACTICFGEYFDGYADRRATMANGFYVKTMQGETYNFAGLGYSEIEISGNIHDNPELLEDKP